MLPKDGEKNPPKMFITESAAHFCGMLDSVTAKTTDCRGITLGNKTLKENTVTVIFDTAKGDRLYFNGKPVAHIDCRCYRICYSDNNASKRYRFASVVFYPGGYKYDYLCSIPDVSVGDKVIVVTNQGETEVEVIRIFEKNAAETSLPIRKYKSVIRKV